MAALLATLLGLESGVTSYPFRAMVVVLALTALLQHRALLRSSRRLHPGLKFFFAAYVLRLLWDGLVTGRPAALEALFFFTVAVLLPTLALLSEQSYPGQQRRLNISLLWLGAVVVLGALASQTVASTIELTEKTGRLYIEALNPISLGHAMATVTLVCVALGLDRKSRAWLPAATGIAILALLCMAMAASRGPAVALAIALLVPIWRSKYRLVAVLLVTLAAVTAVTLTADSDAELIVRLLASGDDESSLERLILQQNALNIFFSSPIVGGAFAEFDLNTYPHNVFIETAMALGLVGLIALGWTLWDTIRSLGHATYWHSLLLTMLFVQYFVAFQFSGAIFGSAAFWATLAWFSTPLPSAAPRSQAIHASARPQT